jgi:hypothetical protein
MSDPPVDVADLVADGRLRPQPPDLVALARVLDAARGDLAAAEAIVATSSSWAETMLYEAGLRAARVIVQAGGFRIATDRGHVTAIDAADALTNGVHHRRFVRLHRMRRMRHDFMCEVGADPSEADLAQARRDVEALLAVATEALVGPP